MTILLFSLTVCACILSWRRPEFSLRTIRAFVAYMTLFEPTVTYEIIVVDQGPGREVADILVREALVPIHMVALETNIGLSAGFNRLFLEECQSPFILSLEEDWQARYGIWPADFPALSKSIELLNSPAHQDILEVWLRDLAWIEGYDNRTQVGARPSAGSAAAGAAVPCARLCGDARNRPVHSLLALWQWTTIEGTRYFYTRQFGSRYGYGSYTNGASLKRRSSILQLGKQQGMDGELRMSAKARSAGFGAIVICGWLDDEGQCSTPIRGEAYSNGMFEHVSPRLSVGRPPPDSTSTETRLPSCRSATSESGTTCRAKTYEPGQVHSNGTSGSCSGTSAHMFPPGQPTSSSKASSPV